MLTTSQCLKLGERCHYICCSQIGNHLITIVSFYGEALMACVNIGRITEPMGILNTNGYICDWEHDREGLLSDFLG